MIYKIGDPGFSSFDFGKVIRTTPESPGVNDVGGLNQDSADDAEPHFNCSGCLSISCGVRSALCRGILKIAIRNRRPGENLKRGQERIEPVRCNETLLAGGRQESAAYLRDFSAIQCCRRT